MISKLQKIYYQEMCLTDAQERADDDSNEDELTDTGQNKAVKDLEVGHKGVMIILWAKVTEWYYIGLNNLSILHPFDHYSPPGHC